MKKRHRFGLYKLIMGFAWLYLAMNFEVIDWTAYIVLAIAIFNLASGSYLFLGGDDE